MTYILLHAVLLVARNVIRWQSCKAHMTPMARNICTCAVFAIHSLILALQLILFHVTVREGHYMPFSD